MLRLVDAPRCPYCARVRIMLAEKGIAYEPVVIDLADHEPTAFQRAHDAVRCGGGMTKFPRDPRDDQCRSATVEIHHDRERPAFGIGQGCHTSDPTQARLSSARRNGDYRY